MKNFKKRAQKARKTINLYNKNLNVSNYDSAYNKAIIKKEQLKEQNEMAERRKNEKD